MRIFIIYKYLTVCFTYMHTFYIRISKLDLEKWLSLRFLFSAFVVRVSRCLFFNYPVVTSVKRRTNMSSYKNAFFYAIMRIKKASFICFNFFTRACNQILLSNFRCFSTNLRSPRDTRRWYISSQSPGIKHREITNESVYAWYTRAHDRMIFPPCR